MKKVKLIFVFFLLSQCYLNAQEKTKLNKLARLVLAIQKNAINTSTNFNVRFEKYFISTDGKTSEISLDSINKLNHLDYDIRVIFDSYDVSPSQFMQGTIVLEPVSEKRKKKLLEFVTSDPLYQAPRKKQ